MRVLIVGCGYLGLKLAMDLVGRGHQVWGLKRSHRDAADFTKAGIALLTADITNMDSLPVLKAPYDWVVNCVSASGGDVSDYERVYVEGTRNLITWLSAAPPARFVYTSSTGVYGQNDGGWVDEDSPTISQSVTGQVLVRAENLLLHAAGETRLPTVVLRAAGIYGPGRSYWLDRLRSDQARLDGDGKRLLNMIHRDDLAGAVLVALERGTVGQVYNIVDDQPVTQLELLNWLSHKLGRPPPSPGGPASATLSKRRLTNKRVSNRKIKRDLQYILQFPTYQEGYETLLRG